MISEGFSMTIAKKKKKKTTQFKVSTKMAPPTGDERN